MAGQRILVVDDEPSLQKVITLELQRKGYEVKGVGNGSEAVELFFTEGADLVITDMHMPIMDGLETVAAIKKLNPEVPIILMTGQFEEDAQQAINIGVSSFLSKPFRMEELLRAVTHCLPMD